MRLNLICYGITKDITGAFNTVVEVNGALTVAELKKVLREKFPDFVKLTSLRIAVNSEYAAEDMILTEKDEVVLIPPVSGG